MHILYSTEDQHNRVQIRIVPGIGPKQQIMASTGGGGVRSSIHAYLWCWNMFQRDMAHRLKTMWLLQQERMQTAKICLACVRVAQTNAHAKNKWISTLSHGEPFSLIQTGQEKIICI